MIMWIEFIFCAYFVFVVVYNFLFSVAGLFYLSPHFLSDEPQKFGKIAVLIPAYKEDGVITKVAKEALKQSYSKSNYDVIVVADSLQKSTLLELSKLDIIIHEVHFQKSTKVKALRSALNTYPNYEIAIILDADNVMKIDFLEKINKCFQQGWKAVQGQRMAKNKNNSIAILDGLSEAISNHINRAGSAVLSMSSPVIGSGMAFDFHMFKDIMNSIDSIGGFDKELQIKVIDQGHKIHYLRKAVVYDEKVDTPEAFKNQRTRWVSSQYIYMRRFLIPGFKALLKGQLSLFNISILMSIQLPRVMNVGILIIFSLMATLLSVYTEISSIYWWGLLLTYILSLLLAIPSTYWNGKLLLALTQLPKTFYIMLLVHLKLKNANKKFIHTPHKH